MGARLALAFSAGMVATVNPCGFALLPAYLSYFIGLDGPEDDRGAGPNPVTRALSVSAAVTGGFLVVFVAMGLVWSSISSVVGQRLPYLTIAIGAGLVILGVAMLRGFEPTVRLPKLDLSRQGRELGSMFLYGISYAVASLSCTIGVFITMVSTTLDESFVSGLAMFVAYGLGMGVTLSVLTIAVAMARSGILSAFRRFLPYVNRVSGVLLILAGVFVSYYAWVSIQSLQGGSSSRIVDLSYEVQGALQRWVERVGGGRLALAGIIVVAAAVVVTLIARSAPPADPSAQTADGLNPGGSADDASGLGAEPPSTAGGAHDGAAHGDDADTPEVRH